MAEMAEMAVLKKKYLIKNEFKKNLVLYFYLHLQDVGNRVTLMTLMSHFYVTILPYVEFRFGTPILDPHNWGTTGEQLGNN
jgi:hypothetical protein